MMRQLRLSVSLMLQFICGMVLVCACAGGAVAEPVPVRHLVGTIHAFLELRSAEGSLLASGDILQDAHGDQVIAHVVMHFKDGSVDDERTVFTQRGHFQLVSDRHIQKGPYFPHPLDVAIDARTGQVMVRSVGKDGKEEVTTDHVDLPADLSNGLVPHILENMPPGAASGTTVSMLVTTPKPRMVKLSISPAGQDPFTIMGSSRQAIHYEIKVDLGGIAGVVAPVIGKQPPNIQVWIVGGQAPTFLKVQEPLYAEGPIVTMQLVSPAWPAKK
jgi:hypothetical protein